MPGPTFNLDFTDHNAQRSYPFATGASRKDITESFRLPDSFIVNLKFAVPTSLEASPVKFFLYTIGVYSGGYALTFAYAASSGTIRCATALVNRATHFRNQVYALTGLGDFSGCTGYVQIGDLTDIQDQPAGSFQFAPKDAYLDPDVIQPVLGGVTSLTVVQGSTRLTPVDGFVKFEALQNFRLTLVQTVGQNPRIQFSAISGEGLNEECICEGDAAPPPPITHINDIQPRADGRYYIGGDPCYVLEPIENGFRLIDQCCQPCCGCPELRAITEDLEVLKQEVTTTGEAARDAKAEAIAFRTLLISKLNDTGCFSCD